MNWNRTPTVVLPCIAAIALGCASPLPTDAEDAAQMRNSNATLHEQFAARAYQRGDLIAARDSSREALRIDPSRAGAARLLARTELLAGRPNEAKEAALRAVRLDEADPAAWLTVFDCADAAGDQPTARRALDEAVARGSVEAKLVRAGLALELGDEEPMQRLLELTPENGTATSLYAEHLARSGRIDDALATLDRSLALTSDPDLARTRQRLGAGRGGPEPELLGQSVEDRLFAASFALRNGSHDTALSLYREAVEREPDSVGPRVGLAEALLASGDSLGAASAFEAALERDPRDQDALLGLARVHLKERDYAAAIRPLERALHQHRDRTATRGLLVAAALGLGDLERAKQEAEDLRRLDPGGPLDLKCRSLIAAAEAAR